MSNTPTVAIHPVPATFILPHYQFASGETLTDLRLHYRTLGAPRRDETGTVRNAVLILHGTGGSGAQFLREEFAGELFGPGQPLDAAHHYIILPDNIGHGASSKPSDGLRARFPHYEYADMIDLHYRLLTEGLGVNHLRLVMGTSMGGMHTWMWGIRHPQFMDALLPLACLPVQIAGRNRMMRRMILDAIHTDPAWHGGDYDEQPRGLITAIYILNLMGSCPLQWRKEALTRDEADAFLHARVAAQRQQIDANDMLYYFDASRNYDPSPDLEKIRAPLLAINSADDQVNPPELGILEREIQRVARGRYVLLPISDATRGHGSHTLAALWMHYLVELLEIA